MSSDRFLTLHFNDNMARCLDFFGAGHQRGRKVGDVCGVDEKRARGSRNHGRGPKLPIANMKYVELFGADVDREPPKSWPKHAVWGAHLGDR